MRGAARIALAIVVLLAGMLVVPRPASGVLTGDASAQVPTPILTDILNSPKPSPLSSPSPTPSGGGGGGGGGGGKGGDGKDDGGQKDGRKGSGKKGSGHDRKDRNGRHKKDKLPKFLGTYRPPGHTFNTDQLVSVATTLRALGWSSEDVIARVYRPFILAGNAAWQNTWGAPRYGPGPIIRRHEGQDVFCDYGAPVLATEHGMVQYDEGGLGGRVARLFRDDGSYWYYAHLSDWNTKDFPSGSTVEPGDIIGYCGNTGNALTTPPHVHFGWYQTNGEAKNPMKMLIGWLRTAETNAFDLLVQAQGKKVKQQPILTSQRRFGDAFVPDVSELEIAGESLWASGSSPVTGALGLAQAALQAALSGGPVEIVTVPRSPQPQQPQGDDGDVGSTAPDKSLQEIIDGGQESSLENAD